MWFYIVQGKFTERVLALIVLYLTLYLKASVNSETSPVIDFQQICVDFRIQVGINLIKNQITAVTLFKCLFYSR